MKPRPDPDFGSIFSGGSASGPPFKRGRIGGEIAVGLTVALTGLALTGFYEREEPTRFARPVQAVNGPMLVPNQPGAIPPVLPVAPKRDFKKNLYKRFLIPAPQGIDDPMIVAAPVGIDDRMIVDGNR